jgi:hypothetical protein
VVVLSPLIAVVLVVARFGTTGTLAGGILPVKFPGAGTLTATVVLAVAGLHGPGVSGYLFIMRSPMERYILMPITAMRYQ